MQRRRYAGHSVYGLCNVVAAHVGHVGHTATHVASCSIYCRIKFRYTDKQGQFSSSDR